MNDARSKYKSALAANKRYFDRFANDFDMIHHDSQAIKNVVTKVVTQFYCKDHIIVRLKKITELMDGGPNGKRICELGCGPGHYALHFARLGAKVVGVDYSSAMLDLFEENRKKAGINEDACQFVQSDVLDFKSDELFDIVVASGLIDYLPVGLGVKLVEKMASLVRPGGQVIITIPLSGGFFNTVRLVVRRIQKIHTYYYRKDNMMGVFEKNGLVRTIEANIVGYWIPALKKLSGGMI